ncbi:hypothetical protein AXG93_2997s1270 [Marchantia polymorpha subsp. ruderalis]|uniref:Methyltransferase type 11 domain-containing protein n=1 Tax=Marchantia polymorpha subsp. ruderalis TaxID=1480154 RepID=A0A176VRF6_MARPO|nr:hypothetical protein AXG93_2997s1270 [Marchantia polymorpha subsp. ruderalis]
MTKGKSHHPQAYGDEAYWDNRYSQDAGSFDWYQRYSGLSPIITKYISKTHRILMVGCGNAVISEDMVNDGYQEIVNVDISQVVIDAMVKNDSGTGQSQNFEYYLRVHVLVDTEVGVSVLSYRMFDSLMCGASAPYSAARMLEEVRRVLKPGGVYMLITYGDPRVRMSHLKGPEMNWSIALHVIPRPGSKRAAESSSRVITDPLLLNDDGTLGPQFGLEDPDLHYVYVCTKEAPVKPAVPDKKKKPAAKK